MATNNRGGNRTANRGRTGNNNNPEGHNQYSSWMDGARERPFTAAAAVGGAVAAGVFLWSRRNQITDQIANLSDQFGEWRETMVSDRQIGTDGGDSFMARSIPRGAGKSQSALAEEALTLKETGRKANRPSDPRVDNQMKTGAIAY